MPAHLMPAFDLPSPVTRILTIDYFRLIVSRSLVRLGLGSTPVPPPPKRVVELMEIFFFFYPFTERKFHRFATALISS